MILPSETQMGKLPKWARDYIAGLKRVIEKQELLIKALSKTYTESNIYYTPVVENYKDKIFLPKDDSVIFEISKHRELRVRIKDGKLNINGDSRIKIELNCSNDFSVSMED